MALNSVAELVRVSPEQENGANANEVANPDDAPDILRLSLQLVGD
jgi:hypothetical protein